MVETFDTSILDFFLSIRNPVLTPIFRIFTWMGEFGTVWIVVGLVFFIRKQTRIVGVMLLLALLLELIFCNGIIKNIVARLRPFVGIDVDTIIRHPGEYSFPSGHTATAAAAIVVIWHHNWRQGIFVAALGSLIAASRMYFYVHYPTDILGGLLIGALLGTISIVLVNSIKDKEWFTKIFRLSEKEKQK